MAIQDNTDEQPGILIGAVPWVSLIVWGALLVAVYALQELFFIILTTFLLSFVVRRMVVGLASRLRPGQESPALERWLTLASFAVIVLLVWVVFAVLGSHFIEQSRVLAAKAQHVRPADTLNSLLSRTVGAYLFHRSYSGPDDPRYQQAFTDYQSQERHGEGKMAAFTELQSDLEIGFELRYAQPEWQRLRDELTTRGGVEDERFERWFLTVKAPALLAQQREAYLARWTAAVGEAADEGVAGGQQDSSAVAKNRDRQIQLMILADVKADPVKLAEFQREWKTATVIREWQEFTASPEYRAEFKQYYEQRRQDDPAIPFDYQTYVSLSEAHAQGQQAFRKAFQAYAAAEQKIGRAQQQQDFEEAMRVELARQWWRTDPTAISLRAHQRQDMTAIVKAIAARVEEAMSYFVSIPAQLVTSLLLTIFITLDMAGLKQGARHLSTSRIAPLYHEIVPSLVVFGRLVGRSFSAQALIALFNTLLTFILLLILGINNELLLCGIVFFASFVPVLGVFIAGVPIVLQALLQPSGSITLALIAVGGILVIHLIEATVLSPRIVGKVLHLHPVLILVIIVVGEHLFGVWGLLLGVPVAVFTLRFAMLNESIPGIYESAPQGPGER